MRKSLNLNRLSALLLGLSLSGAACTEPFDIDLEDADLGRLVVEGSITDERKQHQVRLSETGSYFLNAPTPRVSGASLSITDGVDVFALEELEPGLYQTIDSVAGVPGRAYTLRIETAEGERFEATDWLHPVAPIDSVLYLYLGADLPNPVNPFATEPEYYFYLFTQEPGGSADFYMWDLYKDQVLDSDTLREKTIIDDTFVQGRYVNDFSPYSLTDKDFEGDTLWVGLAQSSVTKEFYDFYISYMLETTWNGGLFAGPPANVQTNVSNNGRGFFSAHAIHRQEVMVVRGQNPHLEKFPFWSDLLAR